MPFAHLFKKYPKLALLIPYTADVLLFLALIGFFIFSNSQTKTYNNVSTNYQKQLSATQRELVTLKNQDQYKKNEDLQKNIEAIESTYSDTVKVYETIQDLKAQKQKTDTYDKHFTLSLSYLANRNYTSASATLTELDKQIASDQAKAQAAIAAAAPMSSNAPASNTPPSSGFSTQKVSSDVGDFTIAIISADLGSTRVIVDTASDGDCHDNCPVLPLSDYISRSGAFAGINGTYFCPQEYPSCAGKTGSFDLLVMNKNKHYLNSDNNVYSSNPAVIFQGGSVRFVTQALGWGRDTGVDGVLSNYPLLVSGSNTVYSDSSDPKFNSKGPRGFVANKGNTVYIGFVYNATMGESAHVLKTLGMENAMNLDEGGSTALWYGGYKLGPGRNIPNAILFVRK
ncbi:hypothetical protein BH09PAT1_BH09PAT1_6700 [soil metagenome]